MGPILSIDEWLGALRARHTASFTTSEFTKAIRALSARYVQSRSRLPDRSPLDSSGKRAAFAVFYAPLHFLTTRAVVRALGAGDATLSSLVDLGCGTGVASAAWALETAPTARPRLLGVDAQGWALAEAEWTWRHFGLEGRTRRGDLLRELAAGNGAPGRRQSGTSAVVCGWAVNELDGAARESLRDQLVIWASRGNAMLVLEPLARGVAPWWDAWTTPFLAIGGRTDEWKFDEALPASLETLNEAAGFNRRELGARTLWVPPRQR